MKNKNFLQFDLCDIYDRFIYLIQIFLGENDIFF